VSDLTRQQFCAALGISESTCRRLEIEGLPYTPVGSRGKRYDLAECKRWLRENRRCLSGPTSTVDDTLVSCKRAGAYIESCQKVRLRVMPSKPKAA
jgi:hypothetical protein